MIAWIISILTTFPVKQAKTEFCDAAPMTSLAIFAAMARLFR